MKEKPLTRITIIRDQMFKLFQERKDELRDKNKRFNDFKERPSLNFYDHDESMSLVHVLEYKYFIKYLALVM